MVKDSTQDGRAGGGSNTSSHMVQEVVVVHPSGTQLNLQWSGYNPVRGFCLTDEGSIVNKFQKPLLQLEFLLRVCHQGGWVVDLCCGSGSRVIVALRLGFSAAGFDIRQEQVDATRQRIAKFAKQEAEAHNLLSTKHKVQQPAQVSEAVTLKATSDVFVSESPQTSLEKVEGMEEEEDIENTKEDPNSVHAVFGFDCE